MNAISVREAGWKDKEEILAISQKIWEGEDYVPVVLEGWLSQGGLLVAELSGKVVGFAKVTELSPGEFWFEGLRVDPAHQGKGVAKALAQAQLEWTLSRQPKTIRLATVETNEPSLHIAQNLGFREVARFFYLEAEVRKPQKVRELRAPAPEEAWEFLRGSQVLAEGKGLLGLGWRFCQASPELVGELAQKEALFTLGEPPCGLLILVPDPYTPRELGCLAFLDGEEGILPALLRFAQGWAAQNGQKILSAMVAAPWIFRFLLAQGFQFIPELGAVLVLEYAPS